MSDFTYKDIVEIALKICNENEFKNDIFCSTHLDQTNQRECKEQWDEKVENRALDFLKAYNLEKNQQESVVGAVFSISMRMLIWIEYHIGTFNFSSDFCIEFLDPSLFTPDGIIDSQKVAEKMSESTFSSLQDFKLACYYCQMDRIPELFRNLSATDKALIYDAKDPKLIRQPDIIKFWSYYYMGDIDKLQKDNVKVDQFRLKTAIGSGSQVAVEYCLKMIYLKTKQSNLVDTVISIVTCRMQSDVRTKEPNSNFVNDTVVFRTRNYSCDQESWTPDCFLTDIFYSLLSNMSESQKTDMIRRLFTNINIDALNLKNNHVRVLDLFLRWPYQEKFADLIKLSFAYLPHRVLGGVILEISNRIEPDVGHFWYGEDKICNYRKLLMDVWTASHESFKKYAFSDKKRIFQNQADSEGIVLKEGKELLFRMFHFSHFTENDKRNAVAVFESATPDERRDFLLSPEGTMVCMMLIETGKLDLFEELVSKSFTFPENVRKFRKKYCFLKVKNEFLELVRGGKWEEAERTMNWGELTEDEMATLKKEIILTKDGKQACRELSVVKSNVADYFVHWCLQSKDFINEFKRSLLFDDEGIRMCMNFLNNDVITLADKLVKWCLPSKDDRKEFKKYLALKIEISFNSNLDGIEKSSAKEFPNRLADWKSSETLLSWCFKTKSDINGFKRKLLENSRENIILKFVELDKWEAADRFLSWLDLSKDEVRKMKKELFFSCSSMSDLFDDLVSSDENDLKFKNGGGKKQAIERFLRWFLVDKDSINEFKSRYRCYRTDNDIQNLIQKLTQASLN